MATAGSGALRPRNKEKGERIRAERKAERKAARDLKKAQRRRPWLFSETAYAARQAANARNAQQHREAKAKAEHQWTLKATPRVVKPVVKKPKKVKKSKTKNDAVVPTKDDVEDAEPRSGTNGRLSTALAEDDAEIAALEKKLGMRKKKKKAAEPSAHDALEDLLGASDDDIDEDSREHGKKRKRPEDDEWLRSKRRKAEGGDDLDDGATSDDADNDSADDDQWSSIDESEDQDSEQEAATASSEGSQSDDDDDSASEAQSDKAAVPKKQRENPYLPPTVSSSKGKQAQYVPPPLRASTASEKDDLIRLRRQSQGLLNRLSEANLVSIVSQVEQLYRTFPRQHVTSALVDLLIGLVADPSTLSDTFLILHAAFVAALYKVVGMDFGAHFLQRLVEAFDRVYGSSDRSADDKDDTTSREGARECINLMAVLSELYNLQVVGTTLMFDYIRTFLDHISEVNTELLLKIMRSEHPPPIVENATS